MKFDVVKAADAQISIIVSKSKKNNYLGVNDGQYNFNKTKINDHYYYVYNENSKIFVLSSSFNCRGDPDVKIDCSDIIYNMKKLEAGQTEDEEEIMFLKLDNENILNGITRHKSDVDRDGYANIFFYINVNKKEQIIEMW